MRTFRTFSSTFVNYFVNWISISGNTINLISDPKGYFVGAYWDSYLRRENLRVNLIGRFFKSIEKTFEIVCKSYLTDQDANGKLQVEALCNLLAGEEVFGTSEDMIDIQKPDQFPLNWSVILGQVDYWKQFSLKGSTGKDLLHDLDFQSLLMDNFKIDDLNKLLQAMDFIESSNSSRLGPTPIYTPKHKNSLHAIISLLVDFQLVRPINKKVLFSKFCQFLSIEPTAIKPPKSNIKDKQEEKVKLHLEANGFKNMAAHHHKNRD